MTLTTNESSEEFADALLLAVPKLRGLARALTRDVSAADDLVQQTLLKAWERRDSLESVEQLTAWSCVILRNTFRSNLRRAKQASEESLGQTEDLYAAQDNTSLTVETREVLLLIDELDADLRDVILLIAVNGISYDEAAKALGIPVGTVKSRLNRARSELRVLVEGEPDTDHPPVQGRKRQLLVTPIATDVYVHHEMPLE